MWRNADIVDLVGWLRNYNSQLPALTPKPGVYGLDLYSLHTSMDAVIGYLDKIDPKAASDARERLNDRVDPFVMLQESEDAKYRAALMKRPLQE